MWRRAAACLIFESTTNAVLAWLMAAVTMLLRTTQDNCHHNPSDLTAAIVVRICTCNLTHHSREHRYQRVDASFAPKQCDCGGVHYGADDTKCHCSGAHERNVNSRLSPQASLVEYEKRDHGGEDLADYLKCQSSNHFCGMILICMDTSREWCLRSVFNPRKEGSCRGDDGIIEYHLHHHHHKAVRENSECKIVLGLDLSRTCSIETSHHT